MAHCFTFSLVGANKSKPDELLAELPKRAEFFWRSAVSACAGQAGAGLELATRSI
jgi:hypothetical protein